MSQLDVLLNHREAILLAEAIGWLHDYRKCSDEQLRVQAANLSNQQGLGRNELTNRFSALNNISINLIGDNCPFPKLIHRQTDTNCNSLPDYLSRCHNTAHFDKQEPDGGEQNYPGVTISSPFGFEQDVPSDLTTQLWGLPWSTLKNDAVNDRANFIEKISKLFIQAGADTRRPINEIRLWDWGTLVGALYKAAISGALLSESIPQARDFRWRLLSIRVSGFDYLTKVTRLPDLLGRQQLLIDGLDKVRCLLEETYPLGNEVYRDENGSIFVVADLPDLLTFTNNSGETLQTLILQSFQQGTLKNDNSLKIGGEITPAVELDEKSWWGQDPDWQTRTPPQNEIPPIGKVLSQTVVSPPSPEVIKRVWQNNVADICTVCGLRPQGQTERLSSRKVCDICEKRRVDRCKSWVTQQSEKTIWIDEVADTNGRLALITGQFELDDWLSGQMVESLVLNPPESDLFGAVKSPSFSRIRRIWETTRRFWQAMKTDFNLSLIDSRQRLLLYLDQTPNLLPFHVYELDLGATKLSVAWYPRQNDGSGSYLISTDNLGYIARQLKEEKEIFADSATAAISVEDYIKSEFVAKKRPLKLKNPEASASDKNQNLLGTSKNCLIANEQKLKALLYRSYSQ
jgi:CRISPR-associated Csx11 family protein